MHESTSISSPEPSRLARWIVSVVRSDQNICDSLKKIISYSISCTKDIPSIELTKINSQHQLLFLLCQCALFQSWFPQSAPERCDLHVPLRYRMKTLQSVHYIGIHLLLFGKVTENLPSVAIEVTESFSRKEILKDESKHYNRSSELN